MNLKCLLGHRWNVYGNCKEKCSVCNKERDVECVWNGCKCLNCGRIKLNAEHRFIACGEYIERCEVCGKVDGENAYNTLIFLFEKYGSNKLFADDSKIIVREIGEALNEAGGFLLMSKIGMRFAKTFPYGGRHLETTWHGIGNWRG